MTTQSGIPSAHLRASQQHDREVAAKALRNVANPWINADHPYPGGFLGFLNDRADAIEAGEVDL